MTLGWNPVPGSARNHDPIEPIEAMVKKKRPRRVVGGLDARPELWSQSLIQKGLKSISGNRWLNSIIMTAVMVNQIAEKTGAVVRNFFMVLEVGDAGGMSA